MANLRVDKITSTETFEKTGSVQFDASSGSGLVVGSSDCDFGTGDFTIEGWFLVQDSAAIRTIFDSRTSDNSSTGLFLGINTDDTLYTYGFPSGTTVVSYGTPEPNTWHHVAVVRNGSDGLVFLDGKLVSSDVNMGSSDYTQEGGTIGQPATSFAAGLYRFKGHISNVRVVKGTALYTSNFKPPMRELEVVPGTIVLACQSKTDASLEKTGKTITVNGTAVASELTPGLLTLVPKAGGGSAITGSVEFNGSTDYLGLPTTTDFTFGTNDFTIEFWLNPGENASNYTILLALTSSTASDRFEVVYHSSTIRVYTDTATWRDTGITPSKGDWHHIAFVRNYSGNSLIMYINGVNRWEVTNTRDYDELFTSAKIGSYADSSYGYLQGFLSNFRINKNTALYTDSFIPPTRELKKVPGTVLLCCQDSNNPLTEATGKTITGYGDLQRADDVELITNGNFSSTDNWTAVGNASLSTSSGQIVLTGDGSTAGGGAAQGFATIVGKKYVLKYEAFSGTISAGQIRIGTSANSFSITYDNSVSASAHDDITFIATSTTTYVTLGLNAGVATSGTFKYDNVSVTLVDGSNKGSNFTPQVGDDRQITFEGVTKINTDAYFYLPTGDTESREATGTYNAGTRGVAMGGDAASPNPDTIIDYITIASTGDAIDFGDLAISDSLNGDAVADHTRGVCLGGRSNSPTPNGRTNAIQFVTISSTGNSQDFGDLVGMKYGMAGFSDSTRGISAGGGLDPGSTANIDYITISSKGNGQDFGDCINTITYRAGFSSSTRGIIAGGGVTPGSGAENNSIEYVTIQTAGNGQDFGDLVTAAWRLGGCSNAVRGVILEGETPAGDGRNAISYVTISTMGNAQDFGDATTAGQHSNGTSSSTRGVFMGRQGASPYANLTFIDYVHIMTTANAQDFGDLTVGKQGVNACSNGHGGLG